MTARILHLSDLHMGHAQAWEPLGSLRRLVDELDPELVLATGDLSHRGRRGELEAAAALLTSLERPLLAVPGNHDLPYTVPARFTRTFDEWEAVFGTTEPSYASEGLAVAGACSARPWRMQGGALDMARLGEATRRLMGAPDRALRVLALHHHLAAPPWRVARKRPLAKRDEVLRTLVAGGVELVVGGHVHQGAIAERREFITLEEGPRRALVLATAPGLGRPRPERHEEARGFNVYEVGEGLLAVRTYAWDGDAFVEVGRRTFERG